MFFEKVVIAGIGLIGSSLARNLRRNRQAGIIAVCDKNPLYLQQAKALGLADEIETDIKKLVRDADLLVLATPVGAFGPLLKEAAPLLKRGSIVTDVGSVKKYALKEMEKYIDKESGIAVIGGHPVAGTEKSGPEAGFADLFRERWCILTPSKLSTPEALAKISEIWQAAGMRIETMTSEHHDKVMAAVSHLPHLIAYSIVGTVADLEGYEQKEIIKYSASGFRDFTRIAGSDPTMWRDILLNNKTTVLELIQRFVEDLIALERNIRWDEGDKLFDLFSRTQKIRKEVIEARQDQPEQEKRLQAELNNLKN